MQSSVCAVLLPVDCATPRSITLDLLPHPLQPNDEVLPNVQPFLGDAQWDCRVLHSQGDPGCIYIICYRDHIAQNVPNECVKSLTNRQSCGGWCGPIVVYKEERHENDRRHSYPHLTHTDIYQEVAKYLAEHQL